MRHNTRAQFLRECLNVQTRNCIEWPYARNTRGYGNLKVEGRWHIASRLLCEWAHGLPPGEQHHAAHSCGNRACVNPQHIRWATPSENGADKLAHGTSARGELCGASRLSEPEVLEIKRQLPLASMRQLARDFGVDPKTIRKIRDGITWAWLEQPKNKSVPPETSHSSPVGQKRGKSQ